MLTWIGSLFIAAMIVIALLPVSVVINKRGEIAARAMGSKDWYSDESVQLFRKLLAEES